MNEDVVKLFEEWGWKETVWFVSLGTLLLSWVVLSFTRVGKRQYFQLAYVGLMLVRGTICAIVTGDGCLATIWVFFWGTMVLQENMMIRRRRERKRERDEEIACAPK